MGIFIDCLIILVIAGCIILGYKKGLMKVAISFIAIILSIVLALIFYKPLSSFIQNNTEIDNKINNGIYEKIKDVDFANLKDEEKENNELLKFSQKYIDEALQNAQDNTAQYVADSLTITVVDALAFIILLIISRIVLIALNLLADIIGNLPIIKQFNKSGGIIYGIIEGVFIVNLVFAILYVVNPICQNAKIEENIKKSNIGSIVYEENIFINTIAK